MTPDQIAARVARDQYGLLSARDASAVGLSLDQIADRVERKGWTRRERGLYALPGAPLRSWHQDAIAAVLLAGPRARTSHLTSAALNDLCRPPHLPHITVPPGASARTKLAEIHRSPIPPVDRAIVAGIPCTTASRSLVESASIVDLPTVAEMIDQAICAGRATPQSLLAALDRAGRRWPGALKVRSGIEIWITGIKPGSPGEVRFLRRLLEWGAPNVATQYEILDADGHVVARVDAAVPSLFQAFEYDTDLFHGPRRYEHDEARHARVEALGWTLHHVCKHDLLPSATRIRDIVRAQLLP